jgi:polar amino acid transport system substrate-binding protein
MMGGSIDVESTPHVGSAFHFTTVFGRQKKVGRATISMPKRLKGIHVLVVDDNETARLLMRNILHGMGILPTLVTSGSQALAVLRSAMEKGKPFDLLFMDQRMRSMDGVETIGRMRAFVDPPPRVVMLTALSRSEMERDMVGVGVDCILQKPVGRILVFNTILDLFGEGGARIPEEGQPAYAEQAVVRGQIGGARVLLAEDNSINQQVAREILEDIGLAVEVASDGAEAVQKMGRALFDCVLMDIQMPVLDGIEAVQRIRQEPQWADIPIIAMTANAMAGDRERYLDVGMVDHVTKPIDKKALYAALIKWIKPRAGLGGESTPGARPTGDLAPLGVAHLAGIDLPTVLDRVNGNHRLLLSLLKEFHRDFAQAEEKMDALLRSQAAGDVAEAGRLAHTIRGMAGNLAAQRLFLAAGALEQAIKEGQRESWPTVMTDFASGLREVLRAIATLPVTEAGVAAAGEAGSLLDPASLLPLMTEWLSWIEEGNLKALQQMQTLWPSLREMGVTEDLLDTLNGQLERMDFAGAKELMTTLMQAIHPAS